MLLLREPKQLRRFAKLMSHRHMSTNGGRIIFEAEPRADVHSRVVTQINVVDTIDALTNHTIPVLERLRIAVDETTEVPELEAAKDALQCIARKTEEVRAIVDSNLDRQASYYYSNMIDLE